MKLSGKQFLVATLLVAICAVNLSEAGYSSSEDERVLTAFRQRFMRPKNHAKVVRQLVHSSKWASFGTVSTDKKLENFPMVNVISISDSPEDSASTGRIYFLLTDLDFTGKDWRKENKVTALFSKEQGGNCSEIDVDPMEPVCPRAMISGKVQEIKKDDKEYEVGWNAFINRHPAATNWITRHNFYLCVLDIEHIYVLDWYGGPKEVSKEEYYKIVL